MHRKVWMKRLMLVVASVFAAGMPLAMSGCNTTAGLGEDVEAAGDALEDTAEDAND